MSHDMIERLNMVRQRTLHIVESLEDHDLYLQHDPLMSPIAWDIGHIGNFEELWGIRQLPGSDDLFPQLDAMYDAVRNPRATRSDLPLPSRAELGEYLQVIRAALSRKRSELSQTDHELLKDDFVYEMLLQHEVQHQETILQTLQLKAGEPYQPTIARRVLPKGSSEGIGEFVRVEGDEMLFGTDQVSGTYDNERPAHRRSVASFGIARFPVTNREFLEFVEAGGYRRRDLFTEEGWSFVQTEGVEAPKYWSREDDQWHERVMNRREPLDPLLPVCHISWHEAAAYARFVGARLPDEFEWEFAARFDPATGEGRLYPWGNEPWMEHLANLDLSGWDRAQVGAYPDGRSPLGVEQMIGEVWEWTSSHFSAWPGFRPFPYDEYSKIFFGDQYRVLRGGSWATGPDAVRGTFRNWDFPIRRQIFAGFRLAVD